MDLPTLTKKDESDLVDWGAPNDIDFIAASFVRKGSDCDRIRQVGAPPKQPGCMARFTATLAAERKWSPPQQGRPDVMQLTALMFDWLSTEDGWCVG